jgi:hypothetical protein
MTDQERIAAMARIQPEAIPATEWKANPISQPQSNILSQQGSAIPQPFFMQQQEEIKRFILNMLGAPTIKVELQDEQLNTAVQLAKDVFIRYLGRDMYAYTIATAYQTEYDWPTDALSIYQVYYRPATLSALGNIAQNLFSDFYLLATDLAVDIYESPTTYWCYLASREMLEKTYGVWGSWENVDYRRFRLYPSPFKDQPIGIFYKSNKFDLTEDKMNLFKRLALAYAKIMLGRIRSKYANIPGSNNNLLTLDGTQLLTEGSTEEKDLMAQMQLLAPLRFEIF